MTKERPQNSARPIVVLLSDDPKGLLVCWMKLTGDARRRVAEPGVAGVEAIQKRMKEKSREITGKGSELQAEA